MRFSRPFFTLLAALACTSLAPAQTSPFGRVTSFNGVAYNFPLQGEVPVLTILVEFSDTKFTYSAADFDNMLNKKQLSAQAYYVHQSAGTFTPMFEIYGTYTAPRRSTSYVNSPASLATDALKSLVGTSSIDLSRYDSDDDHIIDILCMIYAGEGGHNDGTGRHIYPANATTNVRIGDYTVNHVMYVNETDYDDMQGIGTFVHEFGHVLGLPDLYTLGGNYPSSGSDYWTPTYWDTMDTGCDLCYGDCPPNLSAYERHALGWTDPYEIIDEGYIYLSSSESRSRSAIIRSKTDPSEVCYLEYRDQTGWDSFHSGSGLLIWHVRFDQSVWNAGAVNNNPSDPKVAIVPADGKIGWNSDNYYGTVIYKNDPFLAGDPYPGTTGTTSFNFATLGSGFTLANGQPAEISEICVARLYQTAYMRLRVGNSGPETDQNRVILGENLSTTGIGDITAGHTSNTLRVITAGTQITVECAFDAETVQIYTQTGQLAATTAVSADGTACLSLPTPGIYILRAGRQTARVAIH